MTVQEILIWITPPKFCFSHREVGHLHRGFIVFVICILFDGFFEWLSDFFLFLILSCAFFFFIFILFLIFSRLLNRERGIAVLIRSGIIEVKEVSRVTCRPAISVFLYQFYHSSRTLSFNILFLKDVFLFSSLSQKISMKIFMTLWKVNILKM